MTEPEFRVPDAIEPVVAWRYWRLREEGILRSLTGEQQPWIPGKPAVAGCRFGRHDPADTRFQLVACFTPDPHRAPDEGCTCGIYAIRDLRHLRGQLLFGFGPTVVGEVLLWGKVIPGRHGYRAERAYPRSLKVFERFAERSPAAVELLAAYRVPVEVIPDRHAALTPLATLGTVTSLVAEGARGLKKLLY